MGDSGRLTLHKKWVTRGGGIRRLMIGTALSVVGLIPLQNANAQAAASWPADVFAVGTFNHVPGNVTTTENVASIQKAVNEAQAWAGKNSCGNPPAPCKTYVLLAPGDYKTQPTAIVAPPAGQDPAAVLINTDNVWLVGMNRNSVIIDGTQAGPTCSTAPADQVYGPSDYAAGPYTSESPYQSTNSYEGLNGVMVWKASGTWVENLTVCNFLDGSGGDGGAGNEIWWNGGAGTGKVYIDDQGGFIGDYMTTTSTFYASPGKNSYDPDPQAINNPEESAATYGIFSNNWGALGNASAGRWNHTYASNFNDSGYYVGACQDECNQTVNDAWAEYNALGYSGSNSGGYLLVENSQFDNNEDGFDTNSQNGDNPPPQNGACPKGVNPPVLTDPQSHQVFKVTTCWVFFHNESHDNNDPNVPTYGSAAAGPVGTGLSLSGGRNDTIVDNFFANNDAYGNILVPYPDSGGPCTGGSELTPDLPGVAALSEECWFDESDDAVMDNIYWNNGSFGNPTNGDIGATNLEPGPTDCFSGNRDARGLTTSPPEAELLYPTCNGGTVPPDLNVPFTDEVLCDSGIGLVGPLSGATLCPPTIAKLFPGYPRQTTVVMHPLPGVLKARGDRNAAPGSTAWTAGLEDPGATTLPTRPDLCSSLLKSGMGSNPWCPS
jgi:hypothetical protein